MFSLQPFVVKMFTKKEAVDFLERSWGVKTVEKKLRSDRKHFLEEIILVIRGRVPFQLLTFSEMLLIPPLKRIFPSLESGKKDCMSGHGGSCVMINSFTVTLLEALGFSTRLCFAAGSTTIIVNHVVVLVEDLEKEGDLHLVDCGLVLPSFRAISLNFDQESPVYQDSYLEYKLIRHNGLILRMHGSGDIIKRNNPPIEGLDFVVGKWRRYYRFDITNSISPDEFAASFQVAHLPTTVPPLAAWFPGGRTVMIWGNQLKVEKEDGTFENIMIKSDEEILRYYKKYFPTIREDTVRQAYFAWRNQAISKL